MRLSVNGTHGGWNTAARTRTICSGLRSKRVLPAMPPLPINFCMKYFAKTRNTTERPAF